MSVFGNPPVNYADMLLHEGYDDVASLRGAVRGWQGLFDLAQPDLLIYNHAPTALIAARLAQLPAMIIGTGFEIPPNLTPFPSFRPWQNIPSSIFEQTESQVLAHINPILQECGQAPLPSMASLFYSSPVHLTTFPELDSFGPRAGANYLGAFYGLPVSNKVEWQREHQKRVFAYLRPSMASCQTILASLQELDAEVICVIPGILDKWIARYDRLRIFKHPIDLQHLLPDANLVITYGAGTIATALLAGVPVLVAPQMIEQFLAGLPLEKMGAGLILREQKSKNKCSDTLHILLNETCYQQAAQRFAQQHADFDSQRACLELYEMIHERLIPPFASDTPCHKLPHLSPFKQ